MNRQVSVAFITKRRKAEFEARNNGKSEEQALYHVIDSTLDLLKKNPACGKKVQKTLWPKFYKKHYAITNLWKIDLRNGWRITYTLCGDDEKMVCIIIEWFNHTEYNRRFNY